MFDAAQMRAEALATLDALERPWTARGGREGKALLARIRRQRARLLPRLGKPSLARLLSTGGRHPYKVPPPKQGGTMLRKFLIAAGLAALVSVRVAAAEPTARETLARLAAHDPETLAYVQGVLDGIDAMRNHMLEIDPTPMWLVDQGRGCTLFAMQK